MTGRIDEISQAIGSLQTAAANAADHAKAIERKLDALLAALAPLKDLPDRVEALEAGAEEQMKARARAAGFVAGVSAIGGIAGSFATWAAAKFGFH